MNGKRQAVYWDTCCFISLLNRELPRCQVLDAIYNDAHAGGLLIVTSIISVVETNHTFTEQRGQPLDPDSLDQINKVVFNSTAVKIIDLVLPVATKTRDLIRTARASPYGFKLKTADAIHLASAVHFQTVNQQPVKQIHVYEPEWERYQPMIGEAPLIDEPDLMYVENPQAPSVFK